MKKYNRDEMNTLSKLVKERNMDGLRSFVGKTVGNAMANVGKNAVESAMHSDDWDEGKHPRGEGGRFTSGSGSSSGGTKGSGSVKNFSAKGKKMAKENADLEDELSSYGIRTETAHDEEGARSQLNDVISDGGKEFVVSINGEESSYPVTMDGYADAYNDYAHALLGELESSRSGSVDLSGIKFGANYKDGSHYDLESVDSGEVPEADDDDDGGVLYPYGKGSSLSFGTH